MNRHVWMAFISCTLIGVVFMNLPPVLPVLKEVYGINNAQVAFLVTSIILAHAFVQIPAGLMTDLIGIKRTLVSSLILIFLSTFVCSFYTNIYFVIAMRFLSGIGTGFAFTSGIKYATVYTPERSRGLVQGIFGGSFSMGCIIPFFLMPILVKVDWTLVYLISSLFFIIPIGLLILLGKERETKAAIKVEHVKYVFKYRAIWILGFLHSIYFGGIITLGTWCSDFLINSLEVGSLKIAGALGGIMMFISGIGRFAGGFFMYRLSAYFILLSCMVILLFTYIFLGLELNFWTVLLILFFGVFVSSLTFGPVFFMSSKATKEALSATGFGILNFIANLGSLLYPIVFGYFIDLTGEYSYSFYFMSVLCVVGLLMIKELKKINMAPDEQQAGSQ